MEKVVRLYVEYRFDDPQGTMTDEEAIQKAYDKLEEDYDRGLPPCLDFAEVLTNEEIV